jgi:hypothetical protein
MCVYKGVLAKIQTPAHWSLIGSSMTALPPVSLPTSILPRPFVSVYFLSRKENFGARFKNLQFFFYFLDNYVTLNCVIQGVCVLKQDVSALCVSAEFLDVPVSDFLLSSFFSVNVNWLSADEKGRKFCCDMPAQ